MNPNVKIKLDALMAEHEAKQLKLQQTFDLIKDDFIAYAYFRARTGNSFSFPYLKLTELLLDNGTIVGDTPRHLVSDLSRRSSPLIKLCENELVKNGFVESARYRWSLKTVLSDVSEPVAAPEPPPTTPVGLSAKETKLDWWIACSLALIGVITLVFIL